MGAVNNISVFDDCFGCGVCYSVCPTKAIEMKENSDGFYRPKVNTNCIDCGKCLNVCSFAQKNVDNLSAISAYSAWSSDTMTRLRSTSGGFIYELSQHLIKKVYKVIGVRFDVKSKRAEYYLIENKGDLLASVGSKYAQAINYNILRDIDFNDKYLVVSTPCTISSLSKTIPSDKRKNFILVDFFCHGIPSYLMTDKYINNVEHEIGPLTGFHFRSSEVGWQDSTTTKAISRNKERFSRFSQGDVFYKMFLRDRCLAKCCYDDCRFKGEQSCADIRVGDFWGKRYSNSSDGINALLVYTETGESAINDCEGITLNHEQKSDILDGQLSANPPRAKSYKYVKRALQTDKSLHLVSRNADIIDFVRGGFYKKLKYYISRLTTK